MESSVLVTAVMSLSLSLLTFAKVFALSFNPILPVNFQMISCVGEHWVTSVPFYRDAKGWWQHHALGLFFFTHAVEGADQIWWTEGGKCKKNLAKTYQKWQKMRGWDGGKIP